MFVKLKFDQENGVEIGDGGVVVFPHIELGAEATISQLKTQLEAIVKAPAIQLEVRNVARGFNDNDSLQSIMEMDKHEGSTLMLMRCHPAGKHPTFQGFLQLFQTRTAMQSGSFRPDIIQSTSKAPIQTGKIYLDDSETESESSESSSYNSSVSSESSDNSRETARKKRKARPYEGKLKKSKLSSLLYQLSDESGDCNYQDAPEEGQTKTFFTVNSEKKSITASINELEPVAINKPLPDISEHLTITNDDQVQVNSATTDEIPAQFSKDITAAAVTCSHKAEKLAEPLSQIAMDKRDFVVVVVSNEPVLEPSTILGIFFDLFHNESHDLNKLRFDEHCSMILQKNQLWIPCEDEATCQWLITHSHELPASQVMRFRDYFQLRSFNVAIPCVSESTELLNIFNVLQKQNIGLDSSKWAVAGRRLLSKNCDEYEDRVVCRFCLNEMITIYLDEETICYLQKQSFRLKYCFWKVEFRAISAEN